MRSRCFRTAAILVAFAGVASPALAASVINVQGGVSVNRGVGFKSITGPTEVGAGDSVMVSKGGSAQIVYSDTCLVDVFPGAVIRIAASSPCLNPPSQQTGVTPGGQVAFDPFVIGLGAAAIGGGVAAGVLLSKGSSSPVSP